MKWRKNACRLRGHMMMGIALDWEVAFGWVVTSIISTLSLSPRSYGQLIVSNRERHLREWPLVGLAHLLWMATHPRLFGGHRLDLMLVLKGTEPGGQESRVRSRRNRGREGEYSKNGSCETFKELLKSSKKK